MVILVPGVRVTSGVVGAVNARIVTKMGMPPHSFHQHTMGLSHAVEINSQSYCSNWINFPRISVSVMIKSHRGSFVSVASKRNYATTIGNFKCNLRYYLLRTYLFMLIYNLNAGFIFAWCLDGMVNGADRVLGAAM